MKVYPTILLKTKGKKIAAQEYPTMFVKIEHLPLLSVDLVGGKQLIARRFGGENSGEKAVEQLAPTGVYEGVTASLGFSLRTARHGKEKPRS